jgi:hypothetical protein
VSNQSYFDIQYFKTACLKYFKPQSGTLVDCQATQLVSMVGHALSRHCLDYRANVVIEPDFFPTQSCCSCKGHMILGCDISNTVIAPDSVVDFEISGKNLSVVNVKYFRATLCERVNWTSNSKMCSRTRFLAQTFIEASSTWVPLDSMTFQQRQKNFNQPVSNAEIKRR